jgi:hypothetical protein
MKLLRTRSSQLPVYVTPGAWLFSHSSQHPRVLVGSSTHPSKKILFWHWQVFALKWSLVVVVTVRHKHELERLYPPSTGSDGGNDDNDYLSELDHGCLGVLSVKNCQIYTHKFGYN